MSITQLQVLGLVTQARGALRKAELLLDDSYVSRDPIIQAHRDAVRAESAVRHELDVNYAE